MSQGVPLTPGGSAHSSVGVHQCPWAADAQTGPYGSHPNAHLGRGDMPLHEVERKLWLVLWGPQV